MKQLFFSLFIFLSGTQLAIAHEPTQNIHKRFVIYKQIAAELRSRAGKWRESARQENPELSEENAFDYAAGQYNERDFLLNKAILLEKVAEKLREMIIGKLDTNGVDSELKEFANELKLRSRILKTTAGCVCSAWEECNPSRYNTLSNSIMLAKFFVELAEKIERMINKFPQSGGL